MKRLLTAAMLLVMTACAAPVSGTPSATLGLDGTSWVVTRINASAVLTGTNVTMAFADGQVSGSNGCNRYFGPYTLAGSAFSAPRLASTQMACDAAVMTQEQAFMKALAAAVTLRPAGTGLELLDGSQTVVLTLAPAPVATPRPLEGTTWRLVTFVKNDAAESLVDESSITLVVDSEQFSGKACNTYSGTAVRTGLTVKVGPLRSTKMACPGEGVMAQEQRYLTVLQTVTTIAIEGNELTLTAPDGQALIYTAE